MANGTSSSNRLWIKLDKNFFDFSEDIYLCAVYVPPISSTHFENDFVSLENEMCSFAKLGKIILMGDFNARTGQSPDFIDEDSSQINNFDASNLLPANYEVDSEINRTNQDIVINSHGKSLLELCISSRLRILNGRYIGDSLGNHTFMSVNGYSTVDYALVSASLLSSVKYFKTESFTYLSDHVQIQMTLECSIRNTFNYKLNGKMWKDFNRFKWTKDSGKLLINALTTQQIKNDILDFELSNYMENQEGVDGAVENLTKIFENISKISCKTITRKRKRKMKKHKQVWSDDTVYETKKQINELGNRLKKYPQIII